MTARAAATGDRRARYLAVLSADGHCVAETAATLTRGQFHDVVLAGDVAYRFPRDEESRRRLPDRVALLTALARCQLPVTIPEPLDTAHLDRPLGGCYVAVRRVRGEPANGDFACDEETRAALAPRLAALLGGLEAAGRAAGVRRAVPRIRPDHWQWWGGQVRQVLFPLMSPSGRRRAEAELTAVATVAASGDALVHGDLGGANVLLSTCLGGPAVAGVLDWDDACIGNQASDLASLAVTFGWDVAEGVDAARRAGESGWTGQPMIGEARLIAATFALQQALPAALSGDDENLADGLSDYCSVRW